MEELPSIEEIINSVGNYDRLVSQIEPLREEITDFRLEENALTPLLEANTESELGLFEVFRIVLGQWTAWQNQIASVESDINRELQRVNSDLNTTMEELKTRQSELEPVLSEIRSAYEERATQERDISNYQENIRNSYIELEEVLNSSDHHEDVNRIELTIQTLRDEILERELSLISIEEEIAREKGSRSNIKSEIEILKREITDNESQIERNNRSISENLRATSSRSGEELNERIVAEESRIGSIENEIQRTSENLDQLRRNTRNNPIAGGRQRINELESRINSLETLQNESNRTLITLTNVRRNNQNLESENHRISVRNEEILMVIMSELEDTLGTSENNYRNNSRQRDRIQSEINERINQLIIAQMELASYLEQKGARQTRITNIFQSIVTNEQNILDAKQSINSYDQILNEILGRKIPLNEEINQLEQSILTREIQITLLTSRLSEIQDLANSEPVLNMLSRSQAFEQNIDVHYLNHILLVAQLPFNNAVNNVERIRRLIQDFRSGTNMLEMIYNSSLHTVIIDKIQVYDTLNSRFIIFCLLRQITSSREAGRFIMEDENNMLEERMEENRETVNSQLQAVKRHFESRQNEIISTLNDILTQIHETESNFSPNAAKILPDPLIDKWNQLVSFRSRLCFQRAFGEDYRLSLNINDLLKNDSVEGHINITVWSFVHAILNNTSANDIRLQSLANDIINILQEPVPNFTITFSLERQPHFQNTSFQFNQSQVFRRYLQGEIDADNRNLLQEIAVEFFGNDESFLRDIFNNIWSYFFPYHKQNIKNYLLEYGANSEEEKNDFPFRLYTDKDQMTDRGELINSLLKNTHDQLLENCDQILVTLREYIQNEFDDLAPHQQSTTLPIVINQYIELENRFLSSWSDLFNKNNITHSYPILE